MKTWQKPMLVILTRNSPQEAVLAFCKGHDISVAAVDGGPNSYDDSCMLRPSQEVTCTYCQQGNIS